MRPFAAALNALEPELLERLDVSLHRQANAALAGRARQRASSPNDATDAPQSHVRDGSRPTRGSRPTAAPGYARRHALVRRELAEHCLRVPREPDPVHRQQRRGHPRARGAGRSRPRPLRADRERGSPRLCAARLRSEMRRARRARLSTMRESLRRWEDVLALPAQPLPPAGADGRDRRPGLAAAAGRCGCARAGARRHARPRAAGVGRGCRHLRALRRTGPSTSFPASRVRWVCSGTATARSLWFGAPCSVRMRPTRAGPCLRSSAPRAQRSCPSRSRSCRARRLRPVWTLIQPRRSAS